MPCLAFLINQREEDIFMTKGFTIKETENNGLLRAYTITASAEHLEEQINAELLRIGKQVKIPGFRPGKVPMQVLKQKYKKNTLGDVIDRTVNEGLRQTYEQNDIAPALQPDVKIEKFEEDGDLEFSASFEIMPTAPEIDFSKVEIEKPKIDISDDEINNSLQRLAEGKREMKDRAKTAKAKEGDVVVIDFKGFLGDEPFQGGEAQGFSLELGSGQFIPGFEEQLIGAKAGDKTDVEVTFPKEYHSEELAGKKARFDVTVHQVQEVTLPKIDDALAKEYNYESLEQLREFITTQLANEYQAVLRNHLKKQLFDKLESQCDFEIPEKMQAMEFESIWKQFVEEATRNGAKEAELEDQKGEYEAIAKRRVQLGILLSQTAGRNKIEVSQQDLQSAIIAQARQYPGQESKIIEFFQQNPKQVQELRGPILEEKAVDFILEQVKQKEVNKTLEEFLKEEEAKEASGDASSATAKKKPAKKPAATKKKAAPAAKTSDSGKKSAAKKPAAKKTAAKTTKKKDDA